METMDPESLDFLVGTQAANALNNAGIKTFEDLVAADSNLFPGKIKNLGAVLLIRINTLLVSRGFEPKGRKRRESEPELVTVRMRELVTRIGSENPTQADETHGYRDAKCWHRLLEVLNLETGT